MRGVVAIVIGGLALAAPAGAQEGPPAATVSIGAQTATASPSSGCTTLGPAGQPGQTFCGDAVFPPVQFSELRVESGVAVIRSSRPMTLSPHIVIRTRDLVQQGPVAVVTPVQRDAQTWEASLPRITAPAFLTFGGEWATEQAHGHRTYDIGLLPERPAGAVKLVKASWIDRRVALSGTAHADADHVIVRFVCGSERTTKKAVVRRGKWALALRASRRCAAGSRGRVVAGIAGNERVKASQDTRRLRHERRK